MTQTADSRSRAVLRPITQADYPYLYTAEAELGMRHRWRFNGGTPSPENYAAVLWAGVFAQYIVTSPSRSELIGLVTAYNIDPVHGIGYLSAAKFTDGLLSTAIFVDGFGQFIDGIFAAAPLRKLYLETPQYNIDQFGSAVGTVFTEEARLSEHRFHEDRYWDLVILSIRRAEWANFRIGP